jgi:Kef-type K+ transport system membrane component KefB
VLGYVLVDLVVIIGAARLLGNVAGKFGQPRVLGEIVAGIALGPSLLGAIPGHMDAVVFPGAVVPHLKILAELGLVLFMFTVGLELDVKRVIGGRRRVVTVSIASVACPFVLGAALAWVIYPMHSTVEGHRIPRIGFMVFIGVAMAITAFPVLARILAERNLQHTMVGAVALSAAAVGDVLAWTLVSMGYAVVTGDGPAATVRILLLAPVFVIGMVLIVRPVMAVMVRRSGCVGTVTPGMLFSVIAGVFASSWITQFIGLHEIFGAFLFGAIMPRDDAGAWRRALLNRLHPLSTVVLLPVFFVVAGFGVDLRLLGMPCGGWQLALVIVVAVFGKIGGTFMVALLERMSVRDSATVAVLMNTRGLTELVILLVALQAGVLDTEVYTMMAIMALTTTAMTGPLIRLINPNKPGNVAFEHDRMVRE